MREPLRLLKTCGLGLCLLSAAFGVTELLLSQAPNRLAGCILEEMGRRLSYPFAAIAMAESGLIALFAFMFWRVTQPEASTVSRRGIVWLLAGQALIGFLVATELLTLLSFAAPLSLSRRYALRFVPVLIGLHTASYYGQYLLTGGHPLATFMGLPADQIGWPMILVGATATVMHGVTFSLGLFGADERRRASELARINADLMATRRLEAETARVAERLGISRELHDAAGHRLTALNINLRVIRRLAASPDIAQKAEECLFLVGELLNDVRGTVRDLRSLGRIDLKAILETMVTGIEQTAVHLHVDPELSEAEPYHAHTLYRCAQEIVTNALKHASPRNLWLALRKTESGFALEGRDDGAGVAHFEFGQGLSGMRERVLELGGEFGVQSRIGEGFSVKLLIPVRRQAA